MDFWRCRRGRGAWPCRGGRARGVVVEARARGVVAEAGRSIGHIQIFPFHATIVVANAVAPTNMGFFDINKTPIFTTNYHRRGDSIPPAMRCAVINYLYGGMLRPAPTTMPKRRDHD